MNNVKEYYDYWTNSYSSRLTWEELTDESKEWWRSNFIRSQQVKTVDEDTSS
jgi:hypothetical protein